MGLKDLQKKKSSKPETTAMATTPTKRNDIQDNIYYHIIRTHEVGAVVKDGVTKVRQYEYLCRNQSEPVTMKNKINKNGKTTEWYAHCPSCELKILQGFYEEDN